MNTKKLFSTIAILFIALISGCDNDDYVETVGVCPVVELTNPEDGTPGVPLNQVVTATFNEEINPATINDSSFLLTAAGAPVEGSVSHSGKVATFTPANRLAINTLYTGTITTEVKDVDGNALQTNYVWTFTTDTNPRLVGRDPENEAINVALNKTITATFNMSMNPLTLNATTFTVQQGTTVVDGVITPNASGTTFTFAPSAPLAEDKVYTVTITTGAANLAGTELANNEVWTFRTGITPKILSTDPLDLASGVALNKVISATFNMPMNPLTVNIATFTVKANGIAILGTISPNPSGTTFTFTPQVPLAGNTKYTATVTTGAANTVGTTLAQEYTWSFTTLDLTPTVIGRDPLPNATGVALNKVISATFNMPMNLLTINAATFTVKQNGIDILGTIMPNASGTTFTFTPLNPLAGNTLYTVTITTGAQNTSGTGLASDDVWNFTTLIPVIVPPINNNLFFGVFGGNAGITNQGLFTVVNGNIGTTAASTLMTGFQEGFFGDVYTVTDLHRGRVTGEIFADAPMPGTPTKAATALAGLNAARDLYNSISPAQLPGGIVNPGAGELGGLTLAPGIYTASSSFKITNGNLVLDAKGDANAKWYFQAPSSLTVGDSLPSSVTFLGGVGNANNVYWYVGTSAVINYAGGGVMTGNIIANSGVTLSSPANSTTPVGQETVLNGRAISLVSSVTMVNTIINVPVN
jgi:hypothetical protein